jgi:hypothetical protein
VINPVRTTCGKIINLCDWCRRRPGAFREAYARRLCESCARAFDAAHAPTATYRARANGTRL